FCRRSADRQGGGEAREGQRRARLPVCIQSHRRELELLGGLLMMRWMILLVGCYAPATPSGAYRCAVADNACPDGQHCVCGLCVNRDQDSACGFSVEATS